MSNGKRSLGDSIFEELRQAFQDIRHKVVEEGWFGRAVTAAPDIKTANLFDPATRDHEIGHRDTDAEQVRRPSFEELWAPRERSDKTGEIQREHEIDR